MKLSHDEIRKYREIQRRIAAAEIETLSAKNELQEFLMDIEQDYGLVLGRDNIDLQTFTVTKADELVDD